MRNALGPPNFGRYPAPAMLVSRAEKAPRLAGPNSTDRDPIHRTGNRRVDFPHGANGGPVGNRCHYRLSFGRAKASCNLKDAGWPVHEWRPGSTNGRGTGFGVVAFPGAPEQDPSRGDEPQAQLATDNKWSERTQGDGG